MSTSEEEAELFGATYTAIRAARSNIVATSLIRIVLAEMKQVAKAGEDVHPVHPEVWSETLEWICERLDIDNEEVIAAMRKAGHTKPEG